MTTPDDDPPDLRPDVRPDEVRVVGGVDCVNRATIARLAGWEPGDSVIVRAGKDPDFPSPKAKIGRAYWYPIDCVGRYLHILARRARKKKPPSAKPGNPYDLLGPAAAADALHIAQTTFRSYLRYSVPYWEGKKVGRPLLPPPDVEEPITNREGETVRYHREWYRKTLAEHQAKRPGPGTGAGRPKNNHAYSR